MSSLAVSTELRCLGVAGIGGTLNLDSFQDPLQLEESLKVFALKNQNTENDTEVDMPL